MLKNVDLHARAHHGPQLDSFPVANRRSQPLTHQPVYSAFRKSGLNLPRTDSQHML
jgi:hypothetical protein